MGVRNLNVEDLERLLEDGEIKGMVNQVEFDPRVTESEVRE